VCLHRRIQLQHRGKQTRQVPLPNDIAKTHSLNKQHRNWHPLDITSSHIHHILQIWPIRLRVVQQNEKNHFMGENSLPVIACRQVSAGYHSIPKDWYNATNQKLPERRQKCTDLGGEYVKSATVQLVASHQLEACNPAECKSFTNDLHNTFSPSYNPLRMQF